MPNIKSSKKSVKTTAKKTLGNTNFVSRIKNSMKKLEKAVSASDKDLAKKTLKDSIKNIDAAYSKGLVKSNTRNRQKARLSKKVKEMGK